MHPVRLLTALPLLVALAACNQTPPAPPAETPAAPEATSPAQPAAEAPAAPKPAATPSAAAPLFGSWAVDLRECATSAVEISATRFLGAENQCDITQLADNGDGTFTASLICTSEGKSAAERIRMTPVFAPTGEGVTLSYLDRGGEPVTLLRCK